MVTQFVANEALWQKVVRGMAEERRKVEEAAEAEVRELRARLERAGLSTEVEGRGVEAVVRRAKKGPRPPRRGDVSREENALMEDEPDLTNVQEELDNPEDKAADV